MHTNTHTSFVALTLATMSTALHAQTMTLLHDARHIETLAQYQTVDDQFGFDTRSFDPTVPFADWSNTASIDIDRASGSVSMNSLLSDTTFLATGAAQAAAIFDADSSVFTIGFATSRHIVAFNLDQTTTFALIANLAATRFANASITVHQDTQSGDLLHDFSVSDDMLSINEHITLDAGTYFLEFRAESHHELYRADDRAGLASYDAVWAVVPAPATTLLPLAGLMLTARRRCRIG